MIRYFLEDEVEFEKGDRIGRMGCIWTLNSTSSERLTSLPVKVLSEPELPVANPIGVEKFGHLTPSDLTRLTRFQ